MSRYIVELLRADRSRFSVTFDWSDVVTTEVIDGVTQDSYTGPTRDEIVANVGPQHGDLTGAVISNIRQVIVP